MTVIFFIASCSARVIPLLHVLNANVSLVSQLSSYAGDPFALNSANNFCRIAYIFIDIAFSVFFFQISTLTLKQKCFNIEKENAL